MIRRILNSFGIGMVGRSAGVMGIKAQAKTIPPHSLGGDPAASGQGAHKVGRATTLIGLAWLVVIVATTFMMVAYANSPGPAGSPPESLPDSSHIPRDTKHATLVMFMHPRCPCSRASVGELALLMAHCQGRVNAQVFFLKPAEMPDDWVQTDTWREAAAIPGVVVHQDDAGSEARLFHVETSGDLVLYDAKGQLTFHGGITAARGHSGDNAGRSTVEALLLNQAAPTNHTPVFGCSLFECRSPSAP